MTHLSMENIIGVLYALLAVVVIGLALKLPKTKAKKGLAALLAAVAFAYLPVKGAFEYQVKNDAYQERWKETKAIFAEKCKTQAGIKIYRTVPDVEGIVLLKVRPPVTEEQLRDKMWPGAAFVDDHGTNDYITSFLGYETPHGKSDGPTPPISPTNRGYITTTQTSPGSLSGFRYVEVTDEIDGKRYRYTGRVDQPWLRDKRYGEWVREFVLDRTLSSEPSPRYGVTYEDHVVPEERERWIASGTIKVIDLMTQEVLGEMTKYKLSYGGVSPWLRGPECPVITHSTGAETRLFVDQVLIPKREK